MKKHIFVALIALAVLLNSGAVFAASGHCWYAPDGIVATMQIDFAGTSIPVPEQSDGTTLVYVVAPGSTMQIKDIGSFVAQCVDGVSANTNVAVRVMNIAGDGAETEIAGNYRAVDGEACDGGSRVLGVQADFDVATFNAPGIINMRIDYAKNLASANMEWTFYKNVEVRVGIPQIDVNAQADIYALGVKNNSYDDESGQGEILWDITNTGGIDVKILKVEPAGDCNASGGLISCSFTNFDQNVVVKAGEKITLIQSVSANVPNVSPTEKDVAVKVTYIDTLGFLSEPKTSVMRVSYPEQEIRFKIEAQAVKLYSKTGTFPVSSAGQALYAQVCTDSTPPGDEQFVFSLDIYAPGDAPPDNQIASAAFHNIGSCSNVADLTLNNTLDTSTNRSGLARFTPSVAGDYTYIISGFVGYGPYYKNDFARIGTDFNNSTQLVEDFLVNEQLGPQTLLTQESAEQTVVVDASVPSREFDMASVLPSIPASENASNPVYKLKAIKFNGNLVEAGPVSSYSNAEFSVSLPTNKVIASTSIVEETEGDPEEAKLNILWVDKEKYMLEFNVGAVGLCRDLQGNAISSPDALALTGADADPHVKYDWRAASIAANECEPKADGSANTVCDSLQFSIMMMKKLNAIKALAEQGDFTGAANAARPFNAFLMKDGFSDDFRQDLYNYFDSQFFSDEARLLGYKDAVGTNGKGWHAYFSQHDRLNFSVNGGANVNEYALSDPGLYRVSFDFEFTENKDWNFFNEVKEPLAEIQVNLEKTGTVPANLLYYLPIDGTMGTTTNSPQAHESGIHRIGYGTGFEPATQNDVIQLFAPGGTDAAKLVTTIKITSDSLPVVKLRVEKNDSFVETSRNKAGRLLLISSEESGLVMRYSPSFAVPAVIKAEGNGKSISAAYSFSEDNTPVSSTPGFARLTEIAYVPASVSAGTDVCADADTLARLPSFIGQDRKYSSVPAGEAKCSLANNSGGDNAYSFNRASAAPSGTKILLETVFYPPQGKEVKITNACESQGTISIATLGNSGAITGKNDLSNGDSTLFSRPQELNGLGNYIGKVSDGTVCIAVGKTTSPAGVDTPTSVGLWWNEEKVLVDFRAQFPEETRVNACFTAVASSPA